MFCRCCKEVGRCSSLLFEHDWQGVLWCICYGCWREEQLAKQNDTATASSSAAAAAPPVTEEAFEKLRKASWRKRSSSEKEQRRAFELKRELEEAEKLPNESRRQWFRRVISNVAEALAVFVASVLNLKEDEQRDIENVLDRWHDESVKIEKNPDYCPQLTAVGACLPDEILQFTEELVKGVAEYFLCRSGDARDGTYDPCGFFAPGKNWCGTPSALAGHGGQWRCPQCGTEFAAWRSKPSWTTANKVLVIAPETDVQTGLGTVVKAGEVKYVPFVWVDSKTQAAHNALKELALGREDAAFKSDVSAVIQQTSEELSEMTHVQLFERVKEVSDRMVLRQSWWKDCSLTSEAKRLCDEANVRCTRGKTFEYGHLVDGFKGGRYLWSKDEPVLTMEEMGRFWATTRIALKVARQQAALRPAGAA